MKTASATLIALLDGAPENGGFVQADLYTFSYVGGGTTRVTTADVDIKDTVSGFLWSSNGPYIDSDNVQKATFHQKVGVDIDTLQFSVTPRDKDPITGAPFPDKIGTQPWLTAAIAGALDGCIVQVDRAYIAGTWPPLTTTFLTVSSDPTTGTVLSKVFLGRVAEVDITRGAAIVTVNSHLELLTRTMMPRNLHQPQCTNTLFDSGCTLSQAAFAISGTVSSVTTQSIIVASGAFAVPPGSGTYALGRLVFTGGANSGFSRMIKTWDGATRTMGLMSPLPFTINAGDAITAYPGCDKTTATCTAFSNLANFMGEPFIPIPEASI